MTAWTHDLIQSVARGEFILFVGAGVSRNCRKNKAGQVPPTWRELLEALSRTITFSDVEREHFESLLGAGRLLEAAELLEYLATRQSRLIEIRKSLRTLTNGAQNDPFSRMGNPWIDAITELQPRIVLTTNFDKLLDENFDRHSYTSTQLGTQIRTGESVVVKLHGTVEEIEDIVLSQSSYAAVRSKGRHVYEVTQALLMTQPCLFVGYGLNDPDIQLVLENVIGAGREPTGHYILLESSAYQDYQVERLKKSYGLSTVFYAAGDHDDGAALLLELAQLAQTLVL